MAKALLFPGIDGLRKTLFIYLFITMYREGALSKHGCFQNGPVNERYKEIINNS